MNAIKKLEALIGHIEAGRTVVISTCTRAYEINKSTLRKFAAANRPLLKADSTSLFMSVGKRYDCIDFCKITIYK